MCCISQISIYRRYLSIAYQISIYRRYRRCLSIYVLYFADIYLSQISIYRRYLSIADIYLSHIRYLSIADIYLCAVYRRYLSIADIYLSHIRYLSIAYQISIYVLCIADISQIYIADIYRRYLSVYLCPQIFVPADFCVPADICVPAIPCVPAEHSVFGMEWQKRYCVISSNTFYVYGNKKDKQQKEAFVLDDASHVQRSIGMRRDSKRDCCFEIGDNENSTHKFAASSTEAANEWVETIKSLLQDHREEENSKMIYDDVVMKPDVQADWGQEAPDTLQDNDLPPPPSFLLDGLPKPEPVIPEKEYDYKNVYQALWNCTADKEDELSFKRGDLIYVLSKEFDALRWWIGELDNTIGLVPKSYLMEAYEL
uniref:src kinase-associated phosphoprotein 2-like isoform X1 n=1 Tax=Myxine glutinosa TaxID=7769 RepID=UPI00358E6D13